MARRNLRRRAKHSDISRGILLAVAGIVLLTVLGGTAWWIRQTRQIINANTLCPKEGPRAVHAIVFDRSDPIEPQQAQRIKQYINKSIETSPVAQRFDIYTAEGDSHNELHPIAQLCHPGRGRDANEMYQNPKEFEKRFNELFLPKLEQTISSLLVPRTSKTSPIIESIKAAAITSFGNFETGQIAMRMTVISDMVQHTQQYSHFRIRSDANFSELAKTPAWRILQGNLHGAEVTILYLQRPSARRAGSVAIQNRGHQLFWEQLVKASNGHITSFEPI